MKQFLFRIFIFLLLTVSGMSAFLIYQFNKERDFYRTSNILPTENVILIASDSQTEVSLNTEFFPELINRSQSGTAIEIYYMRMFDYVSQNLDKIRAFIVDVSPIKYFGSSVKPISPESTHFEQIYSPFYYLHNATLHRRDVSIESVLTVLRGRSKVKMQGYICGGYSASEDSLFVDHPEFIRPISVSFIDEECLKSIHFVRTILSEMVELARENRIKLIFITTPLHPLKIATFEKSQIDSFEQWMTSFAKENNIPWFNYLNMRFEDRQWRDANHLNKYGAEPFTKRVRHDVMSYLEQNP